LFKKQTNLQVDLLYYTTIIITIVILSNVHQLLIIGLIHVPKEATPAHDLVQSSHQSTSFTI